MATLNVRLTEEEYEKIKSDAEKLGLGISVYIRFITKNIDIKVTLKSDKHEN